MHHGKIPMADYRLFARDFNPVKFDADRWVCIAKDAGMRYIIITAKHHDGFAMFHSRVSPWNIHDATPFKRDPLAELAAACRKHGMPLGFYYSQAQDWNHPGGAATGGHRDEAQDGDMDEYLRTIDVPQVRELLANYGPVAVMWWDTPRDMTPERAEMLVPLLKLQPGIITNNRLAKEYPDDAANTPLPIAAGAEGPVIQVPSTAPDAICSVVVLEIKGPPEVAAILPGQDADGSITLAPIEAICHGAVRFESGAMHDTIGSWTRSPRGGGPSPCAR